MERPAIETLVFGADGEPITTYRKQHLFEHEQRVFAAGRGDGRFELAGFRFALATCFDNHFSELVSRGAGEWTGCGRSALWASGGALLAQADAHTPIVVAAEVGQRGGKGPDGPLPGACAACAPWEVPGMASWSAPAVDTDFDEAQAERGLVEEVRAVLGEEGSSLVHERLVRGNAAEVLVDSAEGAEMLVVGSRGHGGFHRALLGSVSQQVAHHAPCPVTIIRPDTPAE
ncbi:universal stress protein [Streptomyces sp. NPDC055059]|uniref:universal stress protein n=1 Tax=Streptomyces sp. NPDC127172 TaxID=3345382 RepID=UPI0036442D63